MSQLPASLDALTPVWLTGALRSGGLAGAEIAQADVCDASPQDTTRSQYATLRLHYARRPAGAPERVFVKLTTRWPVSGLLGNQYGREIRFYRALAPRLRIRVPSFYFGAAAPDGRSGVIVLEDLGAHRQRGSLAALPSRDLDAAIRLLAALHAQWWNHPELDACDFLFELPPDAHFFRGRLRQALDADVVRRAGLSGTVAALLERLFDRFEALLAALRGPPRTLTHFDFRPENLFFDVGAGDGGESSAALCDWGMVGRGRGVHDIADLAIRATRPASRGEALEALDAYCARLRELGVERPREAWLDDYRRCVALFLFEWVLNVAPEREWSYARAMLALGAHHAELLQIADVL